MTPQEARRAIYIDYEGSKGRDPTLLGVLVEGDLRQVVIDPAFHVCVGKRGASCTEAGDHRQSVADLVAKADRERRHIVSWSEHDRKVMAVVLERDGKSLELLGRWHANAIPLAKPWGKRRLPHLKKGQHTLQRYLRLARYRVDERFGENVAGKALRYLRPQLEEGRSYGELSEGARKRWRALVGHNRHDCIGMAEVVRRAAEKENRRRGRRCRTTSLALPA